MEMPAIRVYSSEIVEQCRIDDYFSLQFRRLWKGVGSFSVTVPFSERNRNALREGALIQIGEDGRKSGRIDQVEYTESDRRRITVTGTTLNGLTRLRVHVRPTNTAQAVANFGYDPVPMAAARGDTLIPVPAETVLKTYIERHMTSPEDSKRRIPRLVCAPSLGRGEKILWLAEQGDSLEDTMGEICDSVNMGYEIRLNAEGKQMVFDVIPGTDRTRGQAETLPVVFSVEFGDVTSVSYTGGAGAYKNVAYAIGETMQQSGLRTLQAIPEDLLRMPEGLERREMSVDCGELSVSETSQALSMGQKARQAMKSRQRTEQLTCDTLSAGMYEYGSDYDIGDMVTVEMPYFGLSIDQRIVEVDEIYEAGKVRIVPVCGAQSDMGVRLVRAVRRLTGG